MKNRMEMAARTFFKSGLRVAFLAILLPGLLIFIDPEFGCAQENPRASPPAFPGTPPSAEKGPQAAPADSGKDTEQDKGMPTLSPEAIAALPARNGNWSIGFDVRKLNITPSNRSYKQRGLTPDINVGYVYIKDSWWVMARGHVPFGPTSVRYPDSPPVDFEGYGLSATFGKSLTSSLRNPGGSYGAEMGVEIFQLVGRSFRRQVLADQSISEAWLMKAGWTAITPALTATFLKPARPQGNRPEWLMTRIEGYHMSLGVVIPVQRSWDLRWEHDHVGQGDRGTWKGVFGVVSLSTWLGI